MSNYQFSTWGFLQLYHHYMTRLPIVTPDRNTQRQLSTFARAGVAGNPVDDEKLNEMVYDLYGLSQAEVRLVKEWF